MQDRRSNLPMHLIGLSGFDWNDFFSFFLTEDLPFYKLCLVNLNVKWDVSLWSLDNTEIILVTILQIWQIPGNRYLGWNLINSSIALQSYLLCEI